MKSLRQRFGFWSLIATATMAIAAGISLYWYVRSAMYQQFDAGLKAKAQAISAMVRIEDNGRYALDFSDESMPEYLPRRKAEYFQVFLPGDKTLERSQSLKGRDLVGASAVPADDAVWNMVLPDGRAGRAMAMIAPAHPDDDDHNIANWQKARTTVAAAPALVVVASERSGIDRVLNALLSALIVAAGVLAVGSIFVVRLVVWQALKPVNGLAERAQAIGPQTLDCRFDVAQVPEELRPICQRLNDLLGRLEQAFSRERRLNADIAHELRTPIAELRTLTEVADRWPGDPARASMYFQDAHDIAMKMGSLVETLLALAHSQTGRRQLEREIVDVSALIDGTLGSYQRQIDQRRLTVSVVLPRNFAVRTERIMFGRIFDNLISNAAAYTTEAGQIRVTAKMTGGLWIVTIGNSHSSLHTDDLSRMFEPFWRKDSARTDSEHTGLGLALVAEYARELEIDLSSMMPSPGWFEIILRLQAAEFVPTEPPRHLSVMCADDNFSGADHRMG